MKTDKKPMPLYYILLLYGSFIVLLFLFGRHLGALLGISFGIKMIGYTLIDAALGALLAMPLIGIYNRLKKRPYFFNWTSAFFYFSILFFILSPMVIFLFVSVPK